jgi:hypothetical protein
MSKKGYDAATTNMVGLRPVLDSSAVPAYVTGHERLAMESKRKAADVVRPEICSLRGIGEQIRGA